MIERLDREAGERMRIRSVRLSCARRQSWKGGRCDQDGVKGVVGVCHSVGDETAERGKIRHRIEESVSNGVLGRVVSPRIAFFGRLTRVVIVVDAQEIVRTSEARHQILLSLSFNVQR